MGHSRKRLDLSGQQYGRLTVLDRAENIGNRTAWNCRCSCGKKFVTETRYLRNGHVTSCGCALVEGIRQRLNYIDGTCVEMLRSKNIRKNNTSGVPGVDWWASKGRWRATICFKGRRLYLGSYRVFEDAVKARKRAEEDLHDLFLDEYAVEAAQHVNG